MNKSKKTMLIVGIIGVVLALAIVALVIGLKSEKADNPDKTETTEQENVFADKYKETQKNYEQEAVSEYVFTADMLAENVVFVKNNDLMQPGTVTRSENGVECSVEDSYNGLKSFYVSGIDIVTSGIEYMTVRFRAVGTGNFSRFRLYLCAADSDKMDSNLLVDNGGDDPINPNVFSVTDPDSEGWQTATFKVGELGYWKHITNVVGFNFGFVNSGLVQEIKEIRFSKDPITYADTPVSYTSGNFPAATLYKDALALKNNDLKDLGTGELTSTGVVYTMTKEDGSAYNGLKSIFVDNIALDTSKYDTMTIRIRSLGGENFSRFRLYLNKVAGAKPDANKLIDTGGDEPLKGDLVTVTDADANGWRTVTIKVGELDFWKNSDVITGFNFGYINSGNKQEIYEIKFTKGMVVYDNAVMPDGTDGFTSGDFPASVLYNDAVAIMNNNLSVKGTAALKDTGVEYTMTKEDGSTYSGLKSIFVDDIALDTTAYDTMTVRIRSLGTGGFTRFRLYLNNVAGAKPDANKLIDTGADLNAGLVTVTEADANGWQTVTINVGELDYWKNNSVIAGFNFGYLSNDATQEIYEIRFTEGSFSYEDSEDEGSEDEGSEDDGSDDGSDDGTSVSAAVQNNIANGLFPAETLAVAGKPIYNNNSEDTASQSAYNAASDTVTYTFESGLAEKSICVNDLTLNPDDYAKVVIKLKADIDFERFRLYLATDAYAGLYLAPIVDVRLDGINKIGTSVNGDCMTISKDASGWTTVTIKVEDLAAWSNANVVNGFRFSYVNEGSTQEVSSIKFIKKSGTFNPQVLYALSIASKNNSTSDLGTTELQDTGVVYTMTKDDGSAYGALKSIFVDNLALDTTEFDTMSIRIRSLGTGGFTRFRLYLNNAIGMNPDANKLLDTGGSPTIAADLLSITEPDADGWQTVTIKVGELDCWKNNSVIGGFNFGYLSTDGQQEISEIKFTHSSKLTVTAKQLNSIGKASWGRTLETKYVSSQTLFADRLEYTFAQTGGHIRGFFIDCSDLDLTEYDTIEYSVKLNAGTSLNHCRFYFSADGGTSVLTKTSFVQKGDSAMTIGAQDSNGWIKITVDVGSLTGWSTATQIDEILVGYVPSTYSTSSWQAISPITFTKSE